MAAGRDPRAEVRNSLAAFDQTVRDRGFRHVAGADESGRGALAGPLVAAAVILPENFHLKDLKDSKKLTPNKRESLFDEIKLAAVAWKVISIEPAEIDRKGLQKANIYALERALAGLDPEPDFILTDRYEAARLKIPHLGVIKGDAVSQAVAAASVLAKVTRDRIMVEQAGRYPDYGFEVHKGYGTSAHLDALERFGPSPIHRLSFARVKP